MHDPLHLQAFVLLLAVGIPLVVVMLSDLVLPVILNPQLHKVPLPTLLNMMLRFMQPMLPATTLLRRMTATMTLLPFPLITLKYWQMFMNCLRTSTMSTSLILTAWSVMVPIFYSSLRPIVLPLTPPVVLGR